MARKYSLFRFSAGVPERLGFFVYALVDPRNKKPFYIGKGKNNRPYSHLKSAAKRREETAKWKRLKEMQRMGRDPSVVVICHGCKQEEEAYQVESAVIEALRHSGVKLTNAVGGRNRDIIWRHEHDINAMLGAKKKKLSEPCILVKINRTYKLDMRPEELMRITCGEWRLRNPRSDRSPAFHAKYILGVKDGVVRTAYRIDHKTWRRNGCRWRCKGLNYDRLVNIDMSDQFGKQARVQYLNCVTNAAGGPTTKPLSH